MTVHLLKMTPDVYVAAGLGLKPWEFRKNDRDFQVGDILHLACWDGESFTDDPPIVRLVVYVLRGGRFGIPDGFCIMTTRRPRRSPFDGNSPSRRFIRRS